MIHANAITPVPIKSYPLAWLRLSSWSGIGCRDAETGAGIAAGPRVVCHLKAAQRLTARAAFGYPVLGVDCARLRGESMCLAIARCISR
jgi:hypothetical protein